MKHLTSIGFILILLKSTLLYGQNIEIPESVITGQDRNIYRTPIFLYPHDFQIKFPEPPEIPQQYLKTKKIAKQLEKSETISKNQSQEFTIVAGKFGYFSSGINLKYPSWSFSFFAMHNDSYRKNNGEDIIEAGIKNSCNEKIEFSFNLWNCIKGIPFPAIIPPNTKKHTSIADMELIYRGKDYNIVIDTSRNSLDKLEETEELLIFNRRFENFYIGTEIGINRFSKKNNGIFSMSGGYNTDKWQAAISLKTIGENTRILPLVFLKTEKNEISFSTILSANFSSPQLWKQAAQQPYLYIKNQFLQPEEIYFLGIEVSRKKTDVYFSIKENFSYEKVGYHWQDLDGDNLYEPAVLKDNFINATVITLGKKFKKFFVEANYSCLNMDKKKSGFPENTGYFKAGFYAGKFNPEFQITWTGSQKFDEKKVKGYTILSALIPYQITPEIQLFIGLNNIAGEKHQIAPGYPGEPFNFIAGFQARW